ncbi:MAG: nitroreductase family protein [Prolixibacteraceae bacterium]|nr:nitroreductase family protein [Prolixibacteraceae bacterium]MBN2774717.1 nitroreductase family protein [Prolixibacteraceae bacterium]
MIRDLIIKNRSYRRFDQSLKIEVEQIKNWIELARFSASGRNAQPLKYIVCSGENIVNKIFPHLGWAGYLPDWKGPEEGERPTAYIAVIHDKIISQNYFCDDGIAMQSILLGAVADGFGGCIFGTVNRNKVAKIIRLPENMEILWIIALGKPVEEVVLEDIKDNNIKYWRDESQVHHVPKRLLDDLILKEL